ncbi:hypothetical protein AMK27_15215 [Streptomyces sp. CB02009]|uniref:hypothetical protein n=1 Tax=Streptomyces sp. CB02009 TaxID=1703938 RepID=UPI000939D156|nr:hypothetical protein [Streptomyces sp. CB02009]OKJ62214.1 hypothetical protein AMK27_15215 [Streptomyces sp. CB02009]
MTEAIDVLAVAGAVVGSLLAATFAIFTLRIASRSRHAAEEARASAVQRTNITIEGNGRVISISDAQLLTREQLAELRRIIENEMPPASSGQELGSPSIPTPRTDAPSGEKLPGT